MLEGQFEETNCLKEIVGFDGLEVDLVDFDYMYSSEGYNCLVE